MRTVRIDEPDSDHTWLWLAGGAALGLVAGLLLADRLKRRRGGLRALMGRGRALASTAMRAVGPLLETAESIKAAWRDDPDDDGSDAELDEAEEVEEIDESEDDEPDDEQDDEPDDEADDEADEDDEALDRRVLEAFSNDPILAERAVEIEETRPGVILLHGRVRSAREARHAITLARGVPGVVRVRERLNFRSRPR